MSHAHAHTDSHARDDHAAGHSHADHAGHSHADHAAPEGMDDLLDLDAEVLHDYWSAALDWVRDAAPGTGPARVLDLGAGTGTGALGLAERFTAAEVIAVDVTTDSLRRLRAKADDLGLAGRVTAVQADLDGDWPDLGPLDLTWASMSLHHLADPGRALRDLRAITQPGGLVAVAEFPEPLRFLPHDVGTGEPGFEDRVITRLNAAHTAEMPTLGSAWAPRLADAGWTVITEREFPIDLDPPAHPDAPRYARAWFERLSHRFTDMLEPGDQATLAALLDADGPHSLLRADNLRIHGSRIVTLATRK
jgi:ubiquinone/menaquinone biosynthesis C-methylase UbiE